MRDAILQTLVYSDIFDYPLRLEEIKKYLIGTKAGEILIDRKLVGEKEGFYFLRGREEIVKIRQERERWSEEKAKIARKTAARLKIIPTIKMIGITGALAMNNCQENDDIDLLIITGANSLWLTRLLIMQLSFFLGVKRRKPQEKSVKDKICFNLFLEENHLKIEPENLFLAHEICQIKPVFNRNQTYERFIRENSWVAKFLANAMNISYLKSQISKPNLKTQNFFLSFFNLIAFYLQYLYMKPKMTIERVNLHQAFFHPENTGLEVEKKYHEALPLLGLDNS